ncbi:hypothetical protein ABAZ39_07360 [Azospirillum argentinense]|uniref:Uncharacterized protein n=1 Tax=Azospirillum argentinense TaxID=2970906 RepID=A0A060DG58_9PROT|nr:hypothetical protein [Azospirillum argentinense]AIB11817.1 hypothetical protein ABAZ39_07360 [Azospirillum argentinense]EZQ09773.1 hypothetical protein ABAZ39_08775 [Azospirillum argentinense]
MAGRRSRSRSMVRALKAPDLYPPRRQTEELRRALDAVEEFGRHPDTLDLADFLARLDAQQPTPTAPR